MKMDSKFEDDMEMEETAVGRHKKHKFMTMEDVSEQLRKDLTDEIEDCNKYYCMAKVAENAHCENDAYYLMEMSKDEYTHAYFIHEFMCERGIHIPEEQAEKYEELKEKMKEFFR